MTNQYFIYINNLCVLDKYTVQFYPNRLTSNYELTLHFNLYSPTILSKSKVTVYTFNSMENVLASLATLNFNTLQHYRTNHPELFI